MLVSARISETKHECLVQQKNTPDVASFIFWGAPEISYPESTKRHLIIKHIYSYSNGIGLTALLVPPKHNVLLWLLAAGLRYRSATWYRLLLLLGSMVAILNRTNDQSCCTILAVTGLQYVVASRIDNNGCVHVARPLDGVPAPFRMDNA